MSKQSSIEQKVFKSSLDLLLYYLPSAIRGQFKEQIEQAKAMHKKEIITTAGYYFHEYNHPKNPLTPTQYYNETFGGNNE